MKTELQLAWESVRGFDPRYAQNHPWAHDRAIEQLGAEVDKAVETIEGLEVEVDKLERWRQRWEDRAWEEKAQAWAKQAEAWKDEAGRLEAKVAAVQRLMPIDRLPTYPHQVGAWVAARRQAAALKKIEELLVADYPAAKAWDPFAWVERWLAWRLPAVMPNRRPVMRAIRRGWMKAGRKGMVPELRRVGQHGIAATVKCALDDEKL